MGKSVLNNTSALLSAGASFVGPSEDLGDNIELMVSIKSDRNCTIRVEQSSTGANWDFVKDFYYVASDSKNFMLGKVHQFFRTSVINTSGFAMGVLRMATYLQEEYSSSVAVGTDATGIERKIAVDAQGKLLMTFVGEVGPQGKSAYQVALDEGGFVGSESAWVLSLKGEQGNQGIQGLQGVQGVTGNAGADGSNGVDGNAGANGNDGADGDSAYQIWLSLGNSGTQSQFIQSIKGASILVKGTLTTAEILALNIASLSFGDSYFSSDAYTLYVFDGATWVSSGSLRGMSGAQGIQGETGAQGEEGANVLVLGNVANASALPTDAEVGHAYFVNDTFSLSVSRGPGLWATSLSLRGPTGATGSQGIQGIQGVIGPGVVAKGSVADVAALNALPTPALGDLYIVESDYKMYIYDGSAFQNSGVSMRGTAGADGQDGVNGADGLDGAQGIQGIQGNTGSVGAQGNSIVVMGNVANASALPTGYDADDAGKAWFVNDTYVMSVWDGSAFQSSASLRGAQGVQGIQGEEGAPGSEGVDGVSLNFVGSVADAAALATASSGWGVSDLNKAYFQTDIFALQVWNGSAFVATTSLRGEEGVQGIQGIQGVTGFSFQLVASQTEAAILTIGGTLGASDQGKVYYGTDTFKLYAWNGSAFIQTTSIRGATGANLLAKGNVADASALSAKVGTAVLGDMWFQDDTFTANVFDGTAFQSSGSLRGPAGAAGADASLATPSIVTYSVASGTDGGQATGGSAAWTTRPLNGLTNASSNGGVSLNTNVITIASTGTFKVEFMGVVHAVGNHKVRLLRINGAGGTIGVGQNDNASNGNSGHSHNIVTANFVAGDQLRLEHYIQNAGTAQDLGAAVSSGEVELYSRVVIEKLA